MLTSATFFTIQYIGLYPTKRRIIMSMIIFLLRCIFSILIATLITGLCAIPIISAGVLKVLLPFHTIRLKISDFSDYIMGYWCAGLALLLRTNINIEWHIDGLTNLNKKSWYLLLCNHQSWADIVLLCVLFRKHIPMNKYFLKQQLAWIPFIGLACWALDMPFMKRYSRETLNKHPHLRGKDIEATRNSCEKFQLRPTTIVNFVEGSRFTETKRIQTQSPYRNLLAPKAAGVAFTLNALGKQFDKILNITLYYPDNTEKPFIAMLCGQMKRIVVKIDVIAVTDELKSDYFNDQKFKIFFQNWLNQIWKNKDHLLDKLKKQYT